MDRRERGGRLHHAPEGDLVGEQALSLHDEGQRIDRLPDGDVPAQEQHHAVEPAAIVRRDAGHLVPQLVSLYLLAPIEPDCAGGILHMGHRVAKAGIAQLVDEVEPDQRVERVL